MEDGLGEAIVEIVTGVAEIVVDSAGGKKNGCGWIIGGLLIVVGIITAVIYFSN